MRGLPYFTTMAGARAAVGAIAELHAGAHDVARSRSSREPMADQIPDDPAGRADAQGRAQAPAEVDRAKNVQAIEEARGHGDLRENADFHAAKEEQGFNEGASRDIDSILALSEVIDPAKLSGSRWCSAPPCELTDTDTGDEVDLQHRRRPRGRHQTAAIAISAPLARALIGREEGDTVTLKTARARASTRSREVRFEPAVRR